MRLRDEIIVKCWTLLAAVFAIRLAAAQTPAADAPRASVPPLFNVRFAPSCEPLDSPPSFQFDVYEDGRVRYLGGDAVRVRGERQYRIRRGEAARLAARVNDDLNRSDFDRHHPPGLPLNWGDNGKIFDGRCLLMTTHANAVSAEGTILLASAVGNELDDRLNRSRRIYFGDRYDQVSVGDVSDLSQLVRSFLAHETDHTLPFQYGTADELLRLRDRIDELTSFDWAHIRASQECAGQTTSYAIAPR